MALLGLILLPFVLPQAILAQESLPDTPKELESFRIDEPAPPPPQPAPAPQPAPTPAPPRAPVATPQNAATPAPSSDETAAAPTQSVQRGSSASQAASTQNPRERNSAGNPPDNRAAPNSVDAAPEAAGDDDSAAQDSEAEIGEIAETGSDPEKDAVSNINQTIDPSENKDDSGWTIQGQKVPLWLLLVGGGLLILLPAILFVARRKSDKNTDAADDEIETADSDDETAETGAGNNNLASSVKSSTANEKPAAAAVPLPGGKEQKSGANHPELNMRFTPKTATLSLARLTLLGELEIVNASNVMARNVKLRSGLTCAGENQEAQISEFFESLDSPDTQSIDNIRKGEKLTISIETSMPIAELVTFAFEGRHICAPIMLAHLGYNGLHDGSDGKEQLAVMVGHEPTSPNGKIGPLRIDTGPRSFDRLGQSKLI